jgi:hypothetical protein
MFVSCKCCVLSSRGLCVVLITRPEECYRVWCVCDREASVMRRPCSTTGCCAIGKKELQITVEMCQVSFLSLISNTKYI